MSFKEDETLLDVGSQEGFVEAVVSETGFDRISTMDFFQGGCSKSRERRTHKTVKFKDINGEAFRLRLQAARV